MPRAHEIHGKFPQGLQLGVLRWVVGDPILAHEFGPQEHHLRGFFFARVIAAIFPNGPRFRRRTRHRADQTGEQAILRGQVALHGANDIGVAAVPIDECDAVDIFRPTHRDQIGQQIHKRGHLHSARKRKSAEIVVQTHPLRGQTQNAPARFIGFSRALVRHVFHLKTVRAVGQCRPVWFGGADGDHRDLGREGAHVVNRHFFQNARKIMAHSNPQM